MLRKHVLYLKTSKQIMKDAKVKYLNKCFEINKLNGGIL